MSETETSANAEAPKKGGSKMIIIIAVVVLVLVAGGGGFFYMRSTAAAAAAAEKAKKSDKKGKKESDEIETAAKDIKTAEKKAESKGAPDPLENAIPSDDESVKKIIELPPFIVNLADTDSARYLRMSVSLGVNGSDGEEKPDQIFMTRVRNAMLAVLSDKKSDEILSIEGKTKLRKQLLEAAKAASAEPEVQAIYITDFIVQL